MVGRRPEIVKHHGRWDSNSLEEPSVLSPSRDAAIPAKVSVRGVTKYFEQDVDSEQPIVALERAEFDVSRGEFLTVIGPSGCGKSTLLNILAGLDEPTSGSILVDGDGVADRKKHFTYMFQRDLLMPWRSVRDNVALGVEVQGTSRREARRRAQGILEEFGLGSVGDAHPATLSGGMRQRAALARTLLCDRDVLLLDEPFGALDALTRAVMQEWLLGIWEKNHRTVVFITHDIDEAVFLSDRVLWMSAAPGHVGGEVVVDIPRPRDRRIVTGREYNEIKSRLLDRMHEEGIKALNEK